MNFSFWSDEDRWFVPRAFGLGYSLNFKYLAKKLGWIKPSVNDTAHEASADHGEVDESASGEDRLRKAIEESRFEDR